MLGGAAPGKRSAAVPAAFSKMPALRRPYLSHPASARRSRKQAA